MLIRPFFRVRLQQKTTKKWLVGCSTHFEVHTNYWSTCITSASIPHNFGGRKSNKKWISFKKTTKTSRNMFMAAKNWTAFISQRPPPPFPSFPRFLSPFGSRTSIHHHWVVEVWRRWHRHLPRLLTNVANPGAETNIAGWKNPTILRKHGGIIHGVFSRVSRRVLSTLAQHVAFGFAEGWGGDYDYLENYVGGLNMNFVNALAIKFAIKEII